MTTNLRRVAILLTTAAVLFLIFGWLGVVAPSERFHLSVPLLWLLDYFVLRRKPLRATQILYGGAIVLLLFLAFVTLAQAQAQEWNSHTDWREAVARVWLCASLLVLYSAWSGLTLKLVQSSPRLDALYKARRGWWLRALRIALAFAVFAPFPFTSFNVHRTKIQNVANPRSEYKLACENVGFRTADGVGISGWFIPVGEGQAPTRKTVLVCHGIGANRSIFLGVVPFLHRAGYNVLMFDFRGHGDSEGHTISFGVLESRDVEAAVKYLESRGQTEIVGYAFSMGGSALLHAIPKLHLRGVLLDSTFARFAPVAVEQTPVPPPLNRVMLAAASFYGRFEIGSFIGDIEPVRYIAQISPRPLLIIHGTADALVPISQARENFAAAREPKELWEVKDAQHCYCRAHDVAKYEARATAFLRRCFAD